MSSVSHQIEDLVPFKVCWPQTTTLRAVLVDPGWLATYLALTRMTLVNTARFSKPPDQGLWLWSVQLSELADQAKHLFINTLSDYLDYLH